MKFRTRAVAAILALTAFVGAPSPASSAPLAHITDLNGAGVDIPAGMAGRRTLLILGFRHSDQTIMDGWRKGLRLTGDQADWLEIPVINGVNPLVQKFIRGGMRGKAPTPADRAHMAPMFENGDALVAALAVSPAAVAVVVIDAGGAVLDREAGDFDAAKAGRLTSAWRAAP